MNIHPMARTTAQLRNEIHDSPLTNAALAKKYNVSKVTIGKWRSRDSFEDKSHCPERLQTTLSTEQELLVVELRKTLFLPLDDLLRVGGQVARRHRRSILRVKVPSGELLIHPSSTAEQYTSNRVL